jgi:O-antigen/teichoic acid export membrane protein
VPTDTSGEMPTQAQPREGLGRVAIRGTAYVFAGQIMVKLMALLSLWVLGYYLTEEQFGLWGLALSTVALAECVRDMGAHKVLIQRGGEFNELGSPVFKLGLWFNIGSAAVLLGLAPVMGRVYDDRVITWLIIIAALTIPLQSPVTIMRARMSIDLRFKTLAKISIAAQFVKNGSMILFAVLGFGVYSFVLPMVLMVLFLLVAFRWCAGPMPPRRALTREHFGTIFAAVKWITVSSFFGALINQGDRLVIGLFEDKHAVGVYFFGFQLILSTVVIFGSGVISVFMPTLSKLAGFPERRAQAYEKMVRVSAVVFSVVCVLAVVTSGPMIHLLWQGRWDAAIPVAQVMSLSLCVYLIGPVAMSYIEASGLWRLRAAMMGAEMGGVLLAAVLGASLGGLLMIAASISGVKAVVSLCSAWLPVVWRGSVLGCWSERFLGRSC